jgi:predicted nucleic acid-binding protein
MLVLDASLVVGAAAGDQGSRDLPDDDLVAPPLLWPEARSVLHVLRWRGDLSSAVAEAALRRLPIFPIQAREPEGLDAASWAVADEFGWAKTYDAEYIALAQILGCRLVTVDARLRRGADRLGFVVGPTEL